uniref:Uncharacterized protein n=1 Tax=Anguilla anguilla TaxID=7936 RepID=A0A0E9V493_ANGAN
MWNIKSATPVFLCCVQSMVSSVC